MSTLLDVGTIAVYLGELAAQVDWLGPKVGGRLVLFCIHQINWIELSQWL